MVGFLGCLYSRMHESQRVLYSGIQKRRDKRLNMGYVNENLITDESVTYRGRLHWVGLVGPALLSTASIGLFAASRAFVDQASVTFLVVGLAVIVVASLPLARALIDRRAAEFAVTNKRVIFKVGFVYRRTAEMFLAKIES